MIRRADAEAFLGSVFAVKSRETYSVRVNCGNCRFERAIDIPKGRPVQEEDCPHCGCQSLRKF